MIMNNEVFPKENLQSLLNEKKRLYDELEYKNLKLTEKMKIKKRMKEIDRKLVKYDPSVH